MLELKITGSNVKELSGDVLDLAQQMGFGRQPYQQATPVLPVETEEKPAEAAPDPKAPNGSKASMKPTQKAASAKEDTTADPAPTKLEATPEITYEQLRSLAGEKIVSGHKAEVSALIKDHGAAKLSGIDPSEFAGFKADLEAL